MHEKRIKSSLEINQTRVIHENQRRNTKSTNTLFTNSRDTGGANNITSKNFQRQPLHARQRITHGFNLSCRSVAREPELESGTESKETRRS